MGQSKNQPKPDMSGRQDTTIQSRILGKLNACPAHIDLMLHAAIVAYVGVINCYWGGVYNGHAEGHAYGTRLLPRRVGFQYEYDILEPVSEFESRYVATVLLEPRTDIDLNSPEAIKGYAVIYDRRQTPRPARARN